MNVKICCICKSENSKYKCPNCRLFYCSASCCKSHRERCINVTESHNLDISNEPQNQNLTEKKLMVMNYDFPTEDTVPLEKLEQMRYSKEIKNCLSNPQLRDIIKSVLESENPTKAIAKAMTEPLFVELADECLKIVEVSDEDKPC